MLKCHEARDFDQRFLERASEVLDGIFENEPDLRDLVTLKSPRECRLKEVVFQIEYETQNQFSSIVKRIGTWLQANNNQSDLENLMLF